jgi:predicted transcriptional regulator
VAVRRAKGGLESEVLAALWAAEAPLTPGEVVDAIGADLAYTTVQTILVRLHAKGAVAREQVGRAYAYTPVLDDAGLAADRMQALLDKGGDHVAVLQRFVHTLSLEDETALAELLARHRQDGRS